MINQVNWAEPPLLNIISLLLAGLQYVNFVKQDSEVLIAINSQGLYVIDPVNVVSHKKDVWGRGSWFNVTDLYV